ncbi:flavodoxin [Enterocloster clostridioformis]|uniref:FprA family A-type flavoprotein n=2 Tax=Enterocloster clostridioformis TaxID=1531 RepID=UPI00080C4315|nr:FprA family A-type flavoprotein [Enterocloster clostridioformis]ANU49993.1 flavodoxin [Lachnoclostridium sp. YL32]NDO28514.1 FprA family A-type flavoprotein [Enterocloster clostridioformis]OXE70946.1 flavodoxin [Enterocloster clostridioformis]QQR01100.1 FprA family A-type flavoprotein [Enterocloster clostridioformis]
MYCVKRINDDLFWVGGTDRRLALFENAYPIPRGVSYNAYLLLDEKTVLFDTVDRAITEQFFENIDALLKGRDLDYVVVNHMEPDHCATLGEIVLRYPEVQVVCNPKTIPIIKQFYNFDIDSRAIVVKENDTLCTGRHTFTFLMAPMVHWPEVMVTYDTTDKTLFSADAFGTFGAMNGNLFADEVNFERDWLDDARRYYTNIVGKYGPSVQTLLKKASGLDIRTLCPLHGPVWREDISWYVDKYLTWSSYEPEEKAVMIAYGSIYGNTENAANILACKLAERGIRNIAMYDASSTHPSTIISEAFRCSHLVFASATYNGGIFSSMEHVLMDLKAHNLQNRTVALMENGSWGVLSGKQMKEIIGSMKNMTILEQMVTVKSSLKESQMEELDSMADAIAESMK